MEIAIVGMSCRFPGANGLAAYWRLLHEGIDAICDDPGVRWRSADYRSRADAGSFKFSCGFMAAHDSFDAQFFGIGDTEALMMDPAQRIVLEQTWHALENAGLANEALRGSRTGVYIGTSINEYCGLLYDSGTVNADNMLHVATGNAPSVVNGRVSYLLGLEGPSMAIDTACSSSLVAVHEAAQALCNDECDMAIAGGINLLVSPDGFISLMRAGMLSPTGRCHTFDKSADGYVRSEGCGIVVLKRLIDAVRDGGRIRAVIRGSAVNQDGRSSSLTAPSVKAQQKVLRAALQAAQLEPDAVDVIECHGTGTQLGDPIEVSALAAVYGQRQRTLSIGSVKTNIGHCEAASGMAGLVKAVLALEHEVVPAQLHFQTANPFLELGGRIRVASANAPWPRGGRARYAGVSSFGFSGTNSHLIVGEAPVRMRASRTASGAPHLLKVSARSAQSFEQLLGDYAQMLTVADAAGLTDLCQAANTGRADLPYRKVAVGRDGAELRAQLEKSRLQIASGAAPRTVGANGKRALMMFTGQGSQYAGMGRELHAAGGVFAECLDDCARRLDGALGIDIREVLCGSQTALLSRTRYLQPALFVLEYALARMWLAQGVRPAALVGHSIGEYAAAHIADVFSLDDALKLVVARGALMEERTEPGAMLSAMTSRASIAELLETFGERICIAAENTPTSVVLAGRPHDIESLRHELTGRQIHCTPLEVTRAFHSTLMRPMLQAFAEVARAVAFHPPSLAIVSTVTATKVADEIATPEYWVRQIEAPVLFAAAIAAAAQRHDGPLLEVGPGSTLASLAAECLRRSDRIIAPTLVRGTNAELAALRAAATLYESGVDIDWRASHGARDHEHIDLPLYPFARRRYWPAAKGDARRSPSQLGERECQHPLLRRLDTALPTYRYVLNRDAIEFYTDHRILGRIIVPATGIVEMLAAVLTDLLGQQRAFTLKNLVIRRPLFLTESGDNEIQISAVTRGNDEWHMELHARHGKAAWSVIATAAGSRLTDASAAEQAEIGALRPLTDEERAALYEPLRRSGHSFGERFQCVRSLWDGGDRVLVEAAVHGKRAPFEAGLVLHPALADSCFQGSSVLLGRIEEYAGRTMLPTGFDQLELFGELGDNFYGLAAVREKRATMAVLDLDFYNKSGVHVGRVRGWLAQEVGQLPVADAEESAVRALLHQVAWKRSEASGAVQPFHYVLLADQAGLAQRMTAQLSDAQSVTLIERREPRSSAARALQTIAAMDGSDAALKVVCCWPIDHAGCDSSAVERVIDELLSPVLQLVQGLLASASGSIEVAFVTSGAQHSDFAVNLAAPLQSTVCGLLRTAIQECSRLPLQLLDIDSSAASFGALCHELRLPMGERQVAYRNGVRLTPALEPLPLERSSDVTSDQLVSSNRGVLDNLQYRSSYRRAPTGQEVEIRVVATGLNFIDVLNALGALPAGLAPPFGHECAGVVVAVGDEVTDVQPGDHVMALAPDCFSAYVITVAALVAPLPPNLSFERAATLPNVFATALIALEHFGGIRAGESVLIHAGAGGVGLAAIQIAQAAGLEVFATAGSENKREYLRRLGVAHVFDSRSLDFKQQILHATGGHGVDLVLNSLAGEFIRAGFDVLSEHGRFLEIGKTGVWSAQSAAQYRPDVAYHVIDLLSIGRNTPQILSEALQATVAGVAARRYRALPVSVFERSRTIDAFRFMAQGLHTGKVVVRHCREPRNPVRADAAYLITGGLGDLGTVAARVLIDHGARMLFLTSHRTRKPAAIAQIERWRSEGITVEVVTADLSQRVAVESLMQRVRASERPLAGIIHAAGALDDAVVENLTAERLHGPFGAKARAAWYLHELTLGTELDFFVLYSSIASVIGNAGQANYAASNAFLDALAHHRASLGLPALSINWGPWSGIGMAARFDNKIGAISEELGRTLVAGLLCADRAQVTVGPLIYDRLPARCLGQEIHARSDGSAQNPAAVDRIELERVARAPAGSRKQALVAFLVPRVARILNVDERDMDTAIPLKEIGLDSLLAIELRNFLHEATATPMPATLLFDYPTLDALADYVLERALGGAATFAPVQENPAHRDVLDDILSDLDGLLAKSDAEVQALLQR